MKLKKNMVMTAMIYKINNMFGSYTHISQST